MLDSTVWELSKEARLLWITMLLKKDRDQVVRSSVPGLVRAANLTLEEVNDALEELQAPDKDSQSPDYNGRRIVKVDEGWFVVNGAKYRARMTQEDRREYNRQKKAEERYRKKNQGLSPLEQVVKKSSEIKKEERNGDEEF